MIIRLFNSNTGCLNVCFFFVFSFSFIFYPPDLLLSVDFFVLSFLCCCPGLNIYICSYIGFENLFIITHKIVYGLVFHIYRNCNLLGIFFPLFKSNL